MPSKHGYIIYFCLFFVWKKCNKCWTRHWISQIVNPVNSEEKEKSWKHSTRPTLDTAEMVMSAWAYITLSNWTVMRAESQNFYHNNVIDLVTVVLSLPFFLLLLVPLLPSLLASLSTRIQNNLCSSAQSPMRNSDKWHPCFVLFPYHSIRQQFFHCRSIPEHFFLPCLMSSVYLPILLFF